MTNSGIYKILNIVTGKFYIGSTVNFYKRWAYHKWVLKNNAHTNSRIQRAWDKYGEEAFVFIVLELCEKEKLSDREQYWLDSTNCCDGNIGYNILKIAYSPMGAKCSDETKAKISASQLGKIMPEESVERMRASKRDIIKWPHSNGCRCKCHECNYKKSEYSGIWIKAKKLRQAQNVQA